MCVGAMPVHAVRCLLLFCRLLQVCSAWRPWPDVSVYAGCLAMRMDAGRQVMYVVVHTTQLAWWNLLIQLLVLDLHSAANM